MIIDHSQVVLAAPSMTVMTSYIEALKEGFYRGIQPVKTPEQIEDIEKNPQKHINEVTAPPKGPITTPDGSEFQPVKGETLWLVQNDIFIGEVSFRHELNDFLMAVGGHVGYGIRPLFKGQGLGTLSLQLTKERAAAMGIDKLLVTCSPENPASEKIIVKNGGVFENIEEKAYGHTPTKRFWVPTR